MTYELCQTWLCTLQILRMILYSMAYYHCFLEMVYYHPRVIAAAAAGCVKQSWSPAAGSSLTCRDNAVVAPPYHSYLGLLPISLLWTVPFKDTGASPLRIQQRIPWGYRIIPGLRDVGAAAAVLLSCYHELLTRIETEHVQYLECAIKLCSSV